jgi:hypothetical protein
MLRQLIVAILIGYLPGTLIFRLPGKNRERRAALDPEERVFWGVLISVALSSVIALTLAAIEKYTLMRVLTINGLISLVILAATRQRLLWPRTATEMRWTAAIPGVLIALGLWLYIPPSEYVMGGRDPGVYFNEGIRIAQRGSLIVHEPVIAAIPPETRQLFMRTSPSRRVEWGLRFMGTFILDAATGATRSQFPQLFPSSIALGYGIDGLTGARRAMVVWGILGVLSLYFLGTRLVGRAAGTAAALLLTVHVVQVWFARYPASEIMMQPLLMAGALAFARAHQDGDGFFAPVAGFLLALPLMFRVEAALVPVAVAAAIIVGLIDGVRPRLWFLLVFCAGLAIATFYLAEVTTSYFRYPLTMVRSTIRTRSLAFWVMAVVGLVLLAPVAYAAVISPRFRAGVKRWVPTLLSLTVFAGAAYAFFGRVESRRLAAYDAEMLRTYSSFYITLPGLVAALAGYLLTMRRALWRDPAFVAIATGYTFFYFYKVRIVPEHFWLMRRFLPIVLPATLLFIAAAGLFGVQRREAGGAAVTALSARRFIRRTLSGIIGVAFLGFLGWQYVEASLPVARHVEYAGVIPQLERLSGQFTDRDLLIVESRNASDLHVLALPLSFIYARNVLLLRSPTPDKTQLETFIADARKRYRNVYFLGGSGTDLLTPAIAVERVSKERFSIPEYEQPYEAYPRGVRLKEFDFGIYRFVDPRPKEDAFVLEMDESDDVSLLRFFAPERSGNDVFRWSGARSYATILGVGPAHRTLVITMSNGGRPARAGAADVTVSVGDQTLGKVTVGDGFQPYTFTIPEPLAGAIADGTGSARLALLTSTWTPRQVIGGGDDRELGVMVSRIELK